MKNGNTDTKIKVIKEKLKNSLHMLLPADILSNTFRDFRLEKPNQTLVTYGK